MLHAAKFPLFEMQSYMYSIPLHVAAMAISGRWSHRMYVAYSAFYIVGTTLVTQVSGTDYTRAHILVRYI